MNNDMIFTKYEVLIQNACEKYVNMYKKNYPEERTIDTAKEYMDKYYDSYKTYHDELKAGTRKSVKVSDIGGLECQKCHY